MGFVAMVLGIGYLFSQKRVRVPGYAWLLFGFIIYTFIWSYLNGEFAERGYRVFSKNQYLHTFFILIVIHNFNFDDRFIIKTYSILKYTIIIAFLVSLIQVINPDFMNAEPVWARRDLDSDLLRGLYSERRVSIFGFIDPAEFGLSFMPLLSVLIGIQLFRKYNLYYLFLFLGGVSAFLTNTRYIMIAFILITLQILIAHRSRIRGIIKYGIIITISGFLMIQVLFMFGYDLNEWFNTRLLAEGSIQETTRYKAIENFIQFFPQKPMFGFGRFTEEIIEASLAVGSSQIHVGYLAGLVLYGLVGGILLFGFWFFLARKLYRTAIYTGYWGSFFAFLIFLWANLTLVTFHIFFYGIIYALIFDKYFTYKHRLAKTNIMIKK